MATNRDPWIGAVLGGTYRLERAIGQGGIAVVYEASHQRVPRKFAVKILKLSLDDELIARFKREARVGAELGHEHIVQVIDFDHMPGGEPYLVMELLSGQDLSAVLAETPVVPVEWALAIIRQVALALEATHAIGVIHRDLKPENIFLCGDPRRRVQVKVMDFGLSKVLGSGTVVTTAVAGTPWYMAPEQIEGRVEISGRADIYALGVILYRLLARRLPFDGENPIAVLDQVLGEQPTPMAALRPDLPSGLSNAVDCVLAKDPDARPGLGELIGELQRALGGHWGRVLAWGQPELERTVQVAWDSPVQPAPPPQDPRLTLPPLPVQPRRKPRAPSVALVIAAAVLAVGSAFFTVRAVLHSRSQPRAVFVDAGRAVDRGARARDRSQATIADAARGARMVRPGPRRLWLSTTPPGAQVSIGGTPLGLTPLEGVRLPAGALTIQVRRAGYRDESLSLAEGSGEVHFPALGLRRAVRATEEARVSVTAKLGSRMATAEILLDGRKIGETPLRARTVAGVHLLEARRGSQRQRQRLLLSPGQEQRVVFRFR